MLWAAKSIYGRYILPQLDEMQLLVACIYMYVCGLKIRDLVARGRYDGTFCLRDARPMTVRTVCVCTCMMLVSYSELDTW